MLLDARLSLARELARIGPVGGRRRIGRVPRPVPTDAIELEYYKALSSLADDMARLFRPVGLEIVSDIRSIRAAESSKKTDAVSGKAEALRRVRQVSRAFESDFPSREVFDITKKFGKRTNVHQRQQLDQQIRAAIGVDLGDVEKPIRDQIPKWSKENVDLIKTVSPRYFARIQKDVEDAYATGMHPETLAEKFEGRRGMAHTDVMRIARDQISKLNGRLNQARQESLGVDSYIWRCVRDNRVRECHAELDGEVCDWDDPPEGGGTDEDEDGHPGSGINCRCYAEPDLSRLLS